jgi:uncharacterized membrane protein YeaQ/YmgE (transglycosylase-associated protein family)
MAKHMIILGWIIFGALTGWIASLVVNRRGEGCLVNTALGLVGAVAGGVLFRQFGPFSYEAHGILLSMLVAVIGAIIVLVLWNAVTGRNRLR